jgi:predicted metal-dependent peptidase
MSDLTTTKKAKKGKNQEKLDKLVGPYDKATDNEARDKLIIARTRLLFKHSFFGNLATRLTLINADEWLPTAATDGRKFYYNSRFINLLKPGEVEFLVAHEVLHVVYDHIGRRDDRDPQIWNIADDYAVNADLKRHKVGDFITSVPCLYETKYDGMGAEHIYDDLMQNAKQLNIDDLLDQLLDDHMDSDGDGDGDEEGQDGKSKKRPGQMSEEERAKLKQEMKENIINAAKAAKEAGHSLPGEVERMVNSITEPKMPWRELIQTNLVSTIRTDYSFMRPSRRGWHMDSVMPGRAPGEEVDIVVALDTSGSISNDDIKVFLGEIQGIMDSFSGYKIHVFCFDTGTHNPAEYTSENLEDISQYIPGGGGGTDFTCIFTYLKEQAIVPNRLVVFTDMCPFGSWGDPDYCDTTWIGVGSYAKGITPPWGSWAYYTE